MTQETLLLLVSVLTLGVATIAAIYSYRGDRRKGGVDIRGYYSVSLSIEAEDTYIGEVVLENMKDRTVVVFGIYLEIGRGDYLQIEQFAEEPLLVQPFTVYRKEYEPVDMYSANLQRVRLDSLLAPGRSPRKRLVLSTAQGRYSVKKSLYRWDPGLDLFRNHRTGVFKPLRSIYLGTAYGPKTQYLVELTTSSGKQEVIPIFPWDYRFSKFQRFNLSRECLQSRDALETFLRARVASGELPCLKLKVFDLAKIRHTRYETQYKNVIDITHQGWFAYHITGRLVTLWRDCKLRNSRRRRRMGETAPGPRGPMQVSIRPSGTTRATDDVDGDS